MRFARLLRPTASRSGLAVGTGRTALGVTFAFARRSFLILWLTVNHGPDLLTLSS